MFVYLVCLLLVVTPGIVIAQLIFVLGVGGPGRGVRVRVKRRGGGGIVAESGLLWRGEWQNGAVPD